MNPSVFSTWCGSGRQTHVEQRKMRTWSRKLGLAGVLTAGSYLLSGCSVAPPDNGFFKFLRFGVPDGITPEAKEIGNFWVWTWVAAWIVGIIMWILMFYSSFAFSAKRKEKKGEGEFSTSNPVQCSPGTCIDHSSNHHCDGPFLLHCRDGR